MSDKTFGWCFIGTGRIAKRVLDNFDLTKNAYLASAYSRSFDKAQELTAQYGGKAYQDIKAAIMDENVKAVYIATPNSSHHEHTMIALECGKPVVCEKPFALNVAQATEMIEAANKNKVYLLEGMWTRFNPAVKQAIEWVRSGKIGRIITMNVDFSIFMSRDKLRVYDPKLGGGGLLDLGVYPIAFSQMMLGENPTEIKAVGTINDTGVDSAVAVNLKYKDGAVARLFSSIEFTGSREAIIYGTDGTIKIPCFWCSQQAELITAEGSQFAEGCKADEGFQYEFDAACDDILAGKLENEFVTHEFTLGVMKILDETRKQIGLKFPQE